MKRSHLRRVLLLFVLTSVGIGWFGEVRTDAQSLDPAVCESVQKSLDRVVSISESTSLSDEEKIRQLSAAWAKSLADLRKIATKDPDTAKVAEELASAIEKLLALTRKSAGTGNRETTEQEQLDLKTVKNLAKPYIAIMRLLCTSLRMPKAVTE
jgi:hypothetical protein